MQIIHDLWAVLCGRPTIAHEELRQRFETLYKIHCAMENEVHRLREANQHLGADAMQAITTGHIRGDSDRLAREAIQKMGDRTA